MSARRILVADESRARLFQEGPAGSTLTELADFVNPEGRAINRELVTAKELAKHVDLEMDNDLAVLDPRSIAEHMAERQRTRS